MIRLVLLLLLVVSASTAQVSYERIKNAASEPENWLTYSGSYASHRYSPLRSINVGNVHMLRAAWVYQAQDRGYLESTPLVADGVMYVTEPPQRVTALDARTGLRLWSWNRPLPDELVTIGFPRTNRGVALLGDSVFVGTLDCYLVALDARSGAERWRVQVAENAVGYSITAAPLAIDGKIIVGISGGETGIRGFLDAYDAETGERLWRLHTIPSPGREGLGDLGRRQLEDRRRGHLAHRLLRPGSQPALLGNRQPRTRLERRRSARRQSLHLLDPRHRSRLRRVALVLPVHPPRRS